MVSKAGLQLKGQKSLFVSILETLCLKRFVISSSGSAQMAVNHHLLSRPEGSLDTDTTTGTVMLCCSESRSHLGKVKIVVGKGIF